MAISRRSNLYSHIKTTDQLIQHKELFEKALRIVGDVQAGHAYTVTTDERNDDLIQILIDLEVVVYDWEEMKKQTHREIGNRLIEFYIEADRILLLKKRILGVDGIVNLDALELIAKEIGSRFSLNKIIQIFTRLGVPESMFTHTTKWVVVFYVLSYYSTSKKPEEISMFLKILEKVLHPLVFVGDEEKASEVMTKYEKYLKYDDVKIVGDSIFAKVPSTEKKEQKWVGSDGIVFSLEDNLLSKIAICVNRESEMVDIDKLTDEQAIYFCRIVLSQLVELLSTVCGNYILICDYDLNTQYIQLKMYLDEILERQFLQEIKENLPEWMPDTILGSLDDMDMWWGEFGVKNSLLTAYGLLEKLWMKFGRKEFSLDPQLVIFLDKTRDITRRCDKLRKERLHQFEKDADADRERFNQFTKPKQEVVKHEHAHTHEFKNSAQEKPIDLNLNEVKKSSPEQAKTELVVDKQKGIYLKNDPSKLYQAKNRRLDIINLLKDATSITAVRLARQVGYKGTVDNDLSKSIYAAIQSNKKGNIGINTHVKNILGTDIDLIKNGRGGYYLNTEQFDITWIGFST